MLTWSLYDDIHQHLILSESTSVQLLLVRRCQSVLDLSTGSLGDKFWSQKFQVPVINFLSQKYQANKLNSTLCQMAWRPLVPDSLDVRQCKAAPPPPAFTNVELFLHHQSSPVSQQLPLTTSKYLQNNSILTSNQLSPTRHVIILIMCAIYL